MKYPSYEQFNKVCKKDKGLTICRISDVKNLKSMDGAVCNMTVLDNTTTVTVSSLVKDIYFNGMGVASNPSVIKNWSGWDETFLDF